MYRRQTYEETKECFDEQIQAILHKDWDALGKIFPDVKMPVVTDTQNINFWAWSDTAGSLEINSLFDMLPHPEKEGVNAPFCLTMVKAKIDRIAYEEPGIDLALVLDELYGISTNPLIPEGPVQWSLEQLKEFKRIQLKAKFPEEYANDPEYKENE